MNKSTFTKLIIVLIVFLFGLSVSACSKNEQEEPIDVEPEVSVDDDEEDGSALTIPEEFPIVLIPIYPDSHLTSVMEVNQSFTIMFYSKDEANLVIEYYKNVFKNAIDKIETNQEDSYTIFGKLDEYTITFDCGPDDDLEGYQTLVLLSVVKN